MSAPVTFTSAYKSLRPAEKAFVDGYVARVEREQARQGERISNALYRPPAPDVIAADIQGMLQRPMVIAAITERINQIAADSELSVSRIVKEYSALAFSNLLDYTTPDDFGGQIDLASATPEQWAAIKKIKVKELINGRRELEIELHSKQAALDALAKFVGMQDNDNPHWSAMNARPIQPAQLPAGASVEDAGDAYAAMIAGD